MTNAVKILSPRVEAIAAAASESNRRPLDELWAEIAETGGPLFEPTDDESTTLVTFLWRDDGNTENVLVLFFTAPTDGDFSDVMLERVPGTDLWFRTYELPSQLRTTYVFSVNDSLRPFTSYAEVMTRIPGYRTDPLNPKTYTLVSNPSEFKVSVLELPLAPKQPWNIPRRGVPRGQIDLHELTSEILRTKHHVSVYTPPGYSDAAEPYHVFVLFDGWSYYNFASVTTVLDNLLYVGRIPPYVLVLHTNEDQAVRDHELPCNEHFQSFLVSELMPWIHDHYNISADPAKAVVGGSCFGGIGAAFAALRSPERFGNVISQSGSYWWPGRESDLGEDWLIRQFENEEKLPIRFALDIGSLEVGSLDYDPMTAHRRFAAVLTEKGYEIDYQEYVGGHDMVCWRGSIVDRLLSFHPKAVAASSGCPATVAAKENH